VQQAQVLVDTLQVAVEVAVAPQVQVVQVVVVQVQLVTTMEQRELQTLVAVVVEPEFLLAQQTLLGLVQVVQVLS
jgi:hypothetical protein